MQVSLSQSQKITSPNPFALVTSLKEDGSTNLMALSWWTYVSNHPATILICTSKRGYTGELIENTGEFALCIVGENLKDSAFLCGTCSGRYHDKAQKFNIPLVPSQMIRPSIVEGSCVALECKLVQSVSGGDHNIFVAEVVHAHYQPEIKPIFAMNGYSVLNTVK